MTYGGVDIQSHIFLTLALVGGEWSASRPGRFTPGERAHGTHWIGGLGPRAGLDDVEKRKFLTLPGIEHRPLGKERWKKALMAYFSDLCPKGHRKSANSGCCAEISTTQLPNTSHKCHSLNLLSRCFSHCCAYATEVIVHLYSSDIFVTYT
jgi:hypothetical protein